MASQYQDNSVNRQPTPESREAQPDRKRIVASTEWSLGTLVLTVLVFPFPLVLIANFGGDGKEQFVLAVMSLTIGLPLAMISSITGLVLAVTARIRRGPSRFQIMSIALHSVVLVVTILFAVLFFRHNW